MPPKEKVITTQLASNAISSVPSDPVSGAERSMDTATFGAITSGDPSLRSYLNQKYNYALSDDPAQRQAFDQSRRLEGAIPVLPESIMFPSAGININKGSYSGSVVGNVPIFAPSQMLPFGVFDARRQAMQQAADQRAKEIDDFNKAFQAPITKRFSVQGELNDTFDEGLTQWVENAKQNYGDDWAKALKNDKGFNSWMQTMRTVAQYEDGIVNHVAEIQKQLQDPNFVASPDLIRTMAAFNQGLGGLENPFDPKGHQLGDTVLRMGAVYDLDKATNTAIDQLIQDVTTSSPGITSQGIYDNIVTTKITGTDKNKLDDLAENIYMTRYQGSGFITLDDVRKSLYAKVGTKVERTVQQQANQFANADGSQLVYDATAVNPEGEQVQFEGNKGGVTTYDGQTFKPIMLNVPVSSNAVDPSTGGPVMLPANAKIQVGKTFNVLVDSRGNIVPNEAKADALGRVKYQTYYSGTTTVTEPVMKTNSKGVPEQVTVRGKPEYKTVEKTIWMPVEGNQNAFTQFNADGTYKSGVRTDVQTSKAQQRSQELTLQQLRTKSTPDKKSEATYTIKGKSYSLSELQALGYTPEQVAPYLTP